MVTFVKICKLKPILYLGVQINCYLTLRVYFPMFGGELHASSAKDCLHFQLLKNSE